YGPVRGHFANYDGSNLADGQHELVACGMSSGWVEYSVNGNHMPRRLVFTTTAAIENGKPVVFDLSQLCTIVVAIDVNFKVQVAYNCADPKSNLPTLYLELQKNTN
ncbi:hypothetical protein EV182_004173, partial [Spiromyces aspiralis]